MILNFVGFWIFCEALFGIFSASNCEQLIPFLVIHVNLSWDSQNWDTWLDSKSLAEREKRKKAGKENLIGDTGTSQRKVLTQFLILSRAIPEHLLKPEFYMWVKLFSSTSLS